MRDRPAADRGCAGSQLRIRIRIRQRPPRAQKDKAFQDCAVLNPDSPARGRGKAQPASGAVLQERAFLVGIDYRTRTRSSASSRASSLTAGAQAARDSASSVHRPPKLQRIARIQRGRILGRIALAGDQRGCGRSRENSCSIATARSRHPDWQRQARGNCRSGRFGLS